MGTVFPAGAKMCVILKVGTEKYQVGRKEGKKRMLSKNFIGRILISKTETRSGSKQ